MIVLNAYNYSGISINVLIKKLITGKLWFDYINIEISSFTLNCIMILRFVEYIKFNTLKPKIVFYYNYYVMELISACS